MLGIRPILILQSGYFMKFDYKNSETVKLFIQHYKGHMGLFMLDMICALAVAAVDLIFPYLSKQCMEDYLPDGLYKPFFLVMVIIIVAYIVRAILYYIITYWGHRMGVYMEADMRRELFGHIEKLSFNFFDKNRTGQLMSRVTTDLFEIAELSHHGPEDLLISCVTIVGAFFILLGIEWRLALIVFAVIPCFVVFTVILRGRMAKSNIKVKAKMGQINSSIESGFSGIRTAKAFANEDIEIEKFEETNRQYIDSKKDWYKAMAIFHSGMEFALPILSVLVIMVGGYYIMGGTMDYIALVTFSLYVSTFITPIRKLVAFVEQYMAGMAGFRRFLEIMRTDPDIVDKDDAVVLENVKGNIVFKNVSFKYKSADETKDVSQYENTYAETNKTKAEVESENNSDKKFCNHCQDLQLESTDDKHILQTTTANSICAEGAISGSGSDNAQNTAKINSGENSNQSSTQVSGNGIEADYRPTVLKDINLTIPAGKVFAFVGPSGGGKTTICHLIPRFYDVTEGSITVDGHDIRDVTQKSLRQSIGIVQQDVFMFAGTIFDNIAYGAPEATEDEVFEAAKKAEIHDEIMAMPDGYKSYIGERGIMLSGGQKQRIGIARVFLKNPPVIILDEATSALDSVTETHIQRAFDELAKGRTTIIIAHRLSTIRDADTIAVIDNNHVMEMGSHAELMQLNGEYAGLVRAQNIER